MRKIIPLDQLTIGMHIVRLDKPWVETPFLTHSMTIKSMQDIDKLRDVGIQTVEVDGNEADASESGPTAPEPRPEDGGRASSAGGQPPNATPLSSPQIPFDEELLAARQAYRDAKVIIGEAMRDVRMGKSIRGVAVARVVRGLIESSLRNPDALLSLTRLKSIDEYTFYHSVNTAILAIGLAHRLGVDTETLFRLGTGALLHDIGKMKTPLHILNKPARLAVDEFEIMKRHALEGAELLRSTTMFPEDVIRPALEHHERVDGTGYPFQLKYEQLTRFGLISSIVDIYDAVTSDRPYHKASTPHRALQLLYELAQQRHLDQPLVEHFIKCIGVYPVGSCVALSSGEMGIVKQINHERPLSPILLLVLHADGRRMIPPRLVNLAEDGDPRAKVAQVLDPRRHGLDINTYLGGAPA